MSDLNALDSWECGANLDCSVPTSLSVVSFQCVGGTEGAQQEIFPECYVPRKLPVSHPEKIAPQVPRG